MTFVPDALFRVLLAAATFSLTGIALVLMVRPPLFLRIFLGSADKASNTATWRLQMRGVGSYFFLVALQMDLAQFPHSNLIVAFRKNLYLPVTFAPVLIPLVLLIIWLIWLRPFIRYAQIEGINEDPRWELKITIVFCSLLLAVILWAFVLAVRQTSQPRSVFDSANTPIPSAESETEYAQSLPPQPPPPPS